MQETSSGVAKIRWDVVSRKCVLLAYRNKFCGSVPQHLVHTVHTCDRDWMKPCKGTCKLVQNRSYDIPKQMNINSSYLSNKPYPKSSMAASCGLESGTPHSDACPDHNIFNKAKSSLSWMETSHQSDVNSCMQD